MSPLYVLLSGHQRAGVKVNDIAGLRLSGFDPHEVGEILCGVFAEMIFEHGFVHGDPHPGLILLHLYHSILTDSRKHSSSSLSGASATPTACSVGSRPVSRAFR